MHIRKENSMATMVYAPNDYEVDKLTTNKQPIVFLGGSIEMGKADEWQADIGKTFKNVDAILLNPRRKDWDSSWEQSIENEQFREQVEWELKGMDDANIVFLNFLADTKSPITLMELGLHAKGNKRVLVCCPEGFWRKGNVDIVCEKYGVMYVDDYEKAKIMLEAIILMWGAGSGK